MPANPQLSDRRTESRSLRVSGALRQDEAASPPSPWNACCERWHRDPRRVARAMVGLLAAGIIGFSVAPLVNNLRGLPNKDYNLWYWTGQAALRGWTIYPTDHRPFPFMYPPSCAALLAAAGVAGETACVVVLVLATSAAWVASILLSVYLATGRFWRQHPLLYLAPTLVVIPFVHDMYLLGQPALLLLACLLGAFACLRVRRPWAAGGLIGLAAAIKAFPILALGYLVWRRQWQATLATLVTLGLMLAVVPMPLRGPNQTWLDLKTWTRGMVLKYDEGSIAQRPERSYSFKNQSLIALAHRLLRSVPADGESKDGWQVNVADLPFKAVNAVILTAGLGLCLFYVLAMPRTARRTGRSDALEDAMLLILILAFTPLSFDYNFIWLLFPLALALHLILDAPAGSRERRLLAGALGMSVAILALAVPFRRAAEAHGNLLVAGLVVLFALGCELWLTTHGKPIANHALEVYQRSGK